MIEQVNSPPENLPHWSVTSLVGVVKADTVPSLPLLGHLYKQDLKIVEGMCTNRSVS